VLGLSHLVNIAFAGALAQSGEAVPLLKQISSSTFNAQLDVATRVVTENPHLYYEIQQGNVNTGEVSAQFLRVLDELVSAVANQDEDGFTQLMRAARQRLVSTEEDTGTRPL
jgi:chorismate mutase/prephenate dehydrogenase